MGKSRFIAVALAGMLGLGLLPGSGLSVTEAASYEGGRGHAYSQRLKEENERHERQVRENRGRYRRGEISQQQYDDNVIREQRHHDSAAELIRGEYEEQANNEH